MRRPCSDSSHVTAPYKLSFYYYYYYNDNCGSLNNNMPTSKRRTKTNGSTASVRTVVENNSGADSDVPEHLRVLFLTTVENNDLPSDVV